MSWTRQKARARLRLGSFFVLALGVATVPASAQLPLVPPSAPPAALEQLRATAQARMRRDLDTFTHEQVRQIEQLYQTANRNLGAPESRDHLLELLDKYPTSNRAGCAALYLAQISVEADREALLKQAIERHADAWYGDGTQVGPMARAYLASLYERQQRRDEAVAIARALADDSPDAVDHRGRRIVDIMKRMGLLY